MSVRHQPNGRVLLIPEVPVAAGVKVEISPPGGEPISSSRTVTLQIDATDRLEDLLRRCSVADPTVVDSGLAGLIVSDRPDFAGAAWVPFSFTAQAQLSLSLQPTSVATQRPS